MKMSGVRPGRRTVSMVSPSSGWRRDHASRSATARSMNPALCQLGSNAGERFGMRMYSSRAGRISDSQMWSDEVEARDASSFVFVFMAGRLHAPPARVKGLLGLLPQDRDVEVGQVLGGLV